MAQHFLLSAAARTRSLGSILRMSDAEEHARFVAIRFADHGGEPYCPRCSGLSLYAYTTRRAWKCRAPIPVHRNVRHNLREPEVAYPGLSGSRCDLRERG